MRAALLVARWRVRHRWTALVGLGLLVAVVAGLVAGAVAGERRTATAADRLIRVTRAPDAFVFVREGSPEEVGRRLEARPETIAAWPVAQYIGRTSGAKDWYYPFAGPPRDPRILRPAVERGRLPDPTDADEVVVSAATAASTGLDVGSTVGVDLYSPDQMARIIEDTEEPPGGSHVRLRVVGVIRDAYDISTARAQRFLLGTPAFARARAAAGDNRFPGFAIRVRGGEAGLDRVLAAAQRDLPPGALVVHATRDSVASIRAANRVLTVGTWALAAVVLGVGGFVLCQTVRRHLGRDADQEERLRAIGFSRADGVAAATAPGVVTAIVAAVGTVGVAAAISPLFPLGRPRLLEPAPGLHLDVPVLSVGALLAAVGTLAVFAAMSWLDLRPRARTRRREPSRWVARVAAVSPPPVLVGLHLATDPSPRRAGVSARTAVVGAAVGLAGLVGSVTFAQSLDRMLATPRQFGMDYDLSMEVPQSQVAARRDRLAADEDLAAVAEQRSATVELAGRPVTGVTLTSAKGSIEPTLVTGRLPSGADEVLVGPALLRRLDASVGDRLRLGRGGQAREVTVVGAALDTTAVSDDYAGGVFARADTLGAVAEDDPYPMLVVRYRPGVDRDAKTAELDRTFPYGVMDESHPSAPAPLQNLADVGVVPRLLAWFFAGLAAVSLANGIVLTGRRARGVLGAARGLGFTSNQVRSTALVMATAMGAAALVVGVPLGVVLGSTTWSQVATCVDLIPVVSWPVVLCVGLVPAALAVAAVVSTWPARQAADPHPAELLRAEQ